VVTLATHLAAAETEDPTFEMELRRTWQQISADREAAINQIPGNVYGKVVQFLDPHGGKLTLAQWSIAWFDALDVAETTEAQYRSLAKNHILARWGDTRLDAISGLAVGSRR
jgi:hypothetical protein